MSHAIQEARAAFDRSIYPTDAIFFFDFDGVLAEQDEEKLFRLPEADMERRRLIELAELAGIDHTLYEDTKYLRHLVFQSYAYGTLPAAHMEAARFARDLDDEGDPYFIVTARSGLWAVQRMIEFVEHYCLYPQEVFCLGRSSKADLLSKLRLDWPKRPFIFFEDSADHIEACKALADPLLEIVEVRWPTCTKEAEKLRREHLGVR